MESAALGAPPPAPTHRLRALRSFLFPEPNLKAPPLDCLSIGSPLCVVTTEGAYSRLAGGGWLYSKHLQPIAAASPDFVATALEFLGKIGRAHVCTPVTNAHLVCRLLLEKKKPKHQHQQRSNYNTTHYQHIQ